MAVPGHHSFNTLQTSSESKSKERKFHHAKRLLRRQRTATRPNKPYPARISEPGFGTDAGGILTNLEVSPGKGSGPRAEINSELQRDMATLSTRACQVIAEESGHGIGNQPELIVEAIREVLLAAGTESRKPGC